MSSLSIPHPNPLIPAFLVPQSLGLSIPRPAFLTTDH